MGKEKGESTNVSENNENFSAKDTEATEWVSAMFIKNVGGTSCPQAFHYFLHSLSRVFGLSSCVEGCVRPGTGGC